MHLATSGAFLFRQAGEFAVDLCIDLPAPRSDGLFGHDPAEHLQRFDHPPHVILRLLAAAVDVRRQVAEGEPLQFPCEDVAGDGPGVGDLRALGHQVVKSRILGLSGLISRWASRSADSETLSCSNS